MSWQDLLFAHWPIAPHVLRALVPPALEIDAFDGMGWLGVVPFRMNDVGLRYAPGIPGISEFLELNVRTYVRVCDRPGVYFFSLDAASAVAVAMARRWFYLNYCRARMSLVEHEGQIDYRSRRTHRGEPPAEFAARYGPLGAPRLAMPGSLEHWLTERYCLYAVDPRGTPWRGEVHHEPWPLQDAHADISLNTMALSLSLDLSETPAMCHFVRRIDVIAWRPERAV